MEIKTPVIYKITNIITNKFYIGSTNNFHLRKYSHLNILRKNKHYNKKLQNSWNKYGESNFIFEIIEHTIASNLLMLEQYYLDYYKPYINTIGYNISKLAIPSSLGIKHVTQQIPWNKGLKLKPSWNKGKTASEETKTKQSLAKSGEKHFNFGKHLSEETKNKIADKQRGEKGNSYGKPSKQRKTVYQFNLDGNLIKTYDFLCDVTNYGFDFKKVSAVALGERKTHKNYLWSYTLNHGE